MDQGPQLEKKDYLTSIKEAKNTRAVIKLSFATFASSVPEDTKIFAMEGVDDKGAYFHWIRNIDPSLRYEPYECNNKSNTLRLFDALQSDLTGLGKRVYYFIDKDFDNYQGRDPHPKIYITEKYSIENSIVCSELLDDLLTIEFHLNGQHDKRRTVIEMFNGLYNQFLELTSAINFRIFLARRLRIPQLTELPRNISIFVSITINSISALDVNIQDLVQLEREPTIDEKNSLLPEFNDLHPPHDYRGKFALSFFSTWLACLRKDRMSDDSIFFQNIPKTNFNISGDFSFSKLISKSRPPNNLNDFLASL